MNVLQHLTNAQLNSGELALTLSSNVRLITDRLVAETDSSAAQC